MGAVRCGNLWAAVRCGNLWVAEMEAPGTAQAPGRG